jgi:RNA polymerase sigma-70 factor (ECF subfamily)
MISEGCSQITPERDFMSGQTVPGTDTQLPGSEASLIEALRNGDEAAFTALVEQYYTSMVRIAMIYVSDQAVAEDVVQETWIGVLRGLDRFEGRSSLKTWIFTILTNRAKTRAQRESRYVPLATVWGDEAEDSEPVITPERFSAEGHWWDDSKPNSWEAIPEDRLLSQETLALIDQAIAELPQGQREVIRLRDIEGWSSAEVCNVLDISETNQRVLLHRARSKVRRALEQYLAA